MPSSTNSTDIKQDHICKLGPIFGAHYNALYNEVAWLHVRWKQYKELFGTSPTRIEILNQAAGLFFRIVQDGLWEDTLLHLTRLTAPCKSRGKENLTIQALPQLIIDIEFQKEIVVLVGAAINANEFAKDWRNRKLAHTDLNLAIQQGAEPLAPASRKNITDAINAISRVIQRISEYYFKSDLSFDVITPADDAVSLLYVIRDGLKAEEKRFARLKEGKYLPEDITEQASV
jgi:hypothetical protein